MVPPWIGQINKQRVDLNDQEVQQRHQDQPRSQEIYISLNLQGHQQGTLCQSSVDFLRIEEKEMMRENIYGRSID